MMQKKANYGKPADHPELLDFNVGDTIPPMMTQGHMDTLHAQGRAVEKCDTGK